MSYSPKQWRAIKQYAEKNNVVPQLSAFPYLRFMDKAGVVTTLHINTLEDFYAAARERQKRAAREATKAERANKSRN